MPSFNSAVIGVLFLLPVLMFGGIYLLARLRSRRKVGNPARLAALLLRMPEDKRRRELEIINQADPDLAYAVKREMHWQTYKGEPGQCPTE